MRVRILSLAAAAMLAAGCSSGERAARSAMARGDEYLRDGKASAAVIEYRNAIKNRRSWGEAYRKLADAYAAEGNAELAYGAYCTAIDLDPNDVHSRVEAGRLLLAAKRYSEALIRAEQALERNERSTDAAVLAARALAKMKRVDEALAQLDVAIGADPSPAAYAALGDVRLTSGDRRGAEEAFRAAIAHSPASVEAHIALAQFLSSDGRTPEAEAEFKAAVAADASSEVANRALAAFYISTRRDAAAEPYLRAAAARPNQTLKSTLALADYLMAANRYDEAQKILETVTSGPMATDAKVRLAGVAFHGGSTKRAHEILDRLMNRRPTAEAWTLNAQILQAEHKPTEALASAQAAVDLDPSAVVAQYIVGTISLDRGDYDSAEAAFRVVAADPRWAPAASLQLARVKLAAGRAGEAVELAESAGDDLTSRLTLARALIADGQPSRARGELERLESAHPTAAEPAVLLGSLELTDGDVHDARAHATRALSLTPDSGDALLLAARTSLSENDPTGAEKYLTRAIASDPASFDATAILAKVYADRGDLGRAQTTLQQFITKHPQVAAARTALGIVFESAKRQPEARAAYEQALALDPVEPVAANNLARLYANDDAQVSRAFELAQTAASKLPNDAEAHDTLGWVAYRSGRLTLAAAELESAVRLNAQEPSYQSHLRTVRAAIAEAARTDAMARAQSGKSDQ